MARIIVCPLPGMDDFFVSLPERWLGEHLIKFQEAGEKSRQLAPALPQVLNNFAQALSLLDDWKLPGINGNPEKIDFAKIDLQVMVWVNEVVNEDFGKAFIVPKAS